MLKKISKTLLVIIIAAVFLSACKSDWNVKVDLKPEERVKIEKAIETSMGIIKEEQSKGGTGKAMSYVSLARSYEKLGDREKAIKLYKDAIDYGIFASAVHHNLGRLYEKVGEYNLAVKQYVILTDKFNEKNYLYDTTWAYIRGKNSEDADKYYKMWQSYSGKTDASAEKAIKQLTINN